VKLDPFLLDRSMQFHGHIDITELDISFPYRPSRH